MSKKIKKMEMDALQKTFDGVQDLVVVSVSGVDSLTDNKMRLDLRKKNIRVQMVKNSLARQVFTQMGINVAGCWEGPTTVVWGANSIAELSRTLDEAMKKGDKVKDKIKVKTVIAEGQELPFDKALTRPTREEAIGRLLAALLGPATTLLGQLNSPATRLASQLKTLSEKNAGEPDAPPA